MTSNQFCTRLYSAVIALHVFSFDSGATKSANNSTRTIFLKTNSSQFLSLGIPLNYRRIANHWLVVLIDMRQSIDQNEGMTRRNLNQFAYHILERVGDPLPGQ